jgi:hypothetical protein
MLTWLINGSYRIFNAMNFENFIDLAFSIINFL